VESPATLENLWAIIALFSIAFIGLAGWVWVNLRAKASAESNVRLWASHNDLASQYNDYRVFVAQNYVSSAQFEKMEDRLTRHFDEKIGDLKAAIQGSRSGGD